MATTHTIKHGDTLPKLTVTLYQDAALSVPVDLSNASQVKIKVGDGNNPLLLDKVMVITDAVNGVLEYQFVVVDWDSITPADHNMEFEVTWNNGDISTYPKIGYATLSVGIDLDP